MSWGPRRYECYAGEAASSAAQGAGVSTARLTRIQELQERLRTAPQDEHEGITNELTEAYQAAAQAATGLEKHIAEAAPKTPAPHAKRNWYGIRWLAVEEDGIRVARETDVDLEAADFIKRGGFLHLRRQAADTDRIHVAEEMDVDSKTAAFIERLFQPPGPDDDLLRL